MIDIDSFVLGALLGIGFMAIGTLVVVVMMERE